MSHYRGVVWIIIFVDLMVSHFGLLGRAAILDLAGALLARDPCVPQQESESHAVAPR